MENNRDVVDNYAVILEKDEVILLQQHVHWVYFSGMLTTVVLSGVILFVLYLADVFRAVVLMGLSLGLILQLLMGLFMVLNVIDSYLNYQASCYIITNKRVIVCSGWLIKNMRDIMLHQIVGVTVVQTIMGRVLNYGSVVLYGMGTCVDNLPLLADPFQFRAQIQEALQSPGEE